MRHPPQGPAPRPTRRALAAGLMAWIWACLLLVGCGERPASPSIVNNLRILGLRAAPAQPSPGDQLSLDILWADPKINCSERRPCPEGQSCQNGRCERARESLEIAWIIVPLQNFQSSETTLPSLETEVCDDIRCPYPLPCDDQAPCPFGGACRDGWCDPCLQFGPVTICCGDEELVHLETTVPPSLTSEEPDCSDPAYRASVQLLQVQAQICRGGRLNLCPKAGELTLPCDGDGAATVTATSRVALARPNLPANRRPTIGAVDWRTPLDGPAPVEVKGCLEPSCDDRQCGDEDDCDAGQVCHENRCREEFALTLEEGDIEDFLLDCEESRPCADRSDCPDRWDCRDGQCRRRENPVTSFFTTAGSFSRSRVVLDSDADGLPDQSTFTTRWLPPVLEGCRAEDAPCAFGSCDLDVGYCVGEVSFWSVVRDERGGQDWAQWTMRVVP